MNAQTAESAFSRHLDLAVLRGRPQGLVTCTFHPHDRTPSLSVDLNKGIFHCFGCGVGGSIRKFLELVGEQPSEMPRSRPDEDPHLAARRDVLRRAKGQGWARPFVSFAFETSDWIRHRRRRVDEVRNLITTCANRGECDGCWELARIAARDEALVNAVETELDVLIGEGLGRR